MKKLATFFLIIAVITGCTPQTKTLSAFPSMTGDPESLESRSSISRANPTTQKFTDTSSAIERETITPTPAADTDKPFPKHIGAEAFLTS